MSWSHGESVLLCCHRVVSTSYAAVQSKCFWSFPEAFLLALLSGVPATHTAGSPRVEVLLSAASPASLRLRCVGRGRARAPPACWNKRRPSSRAAARCAAGWRYPQCWRRSRSTTTAWPPAPPCSLPTSPRGSLPPPLWEGGAPELWGNKSWCWVLVLCVSGDKFRRIGKISVNKKSDVVKVAMSRREMRTHLSRS